jgi:Protein required for attachment to host cells
MVTASIVITADRGSLKAYEVNETPTRGPSLKLIQAFDITDAHGRLLDKVTDQAGRFAATETSGAQRGAASIAETKLGNETARRINRELAEQIAKVINGSGREGWALAAPAEIHSAIVDLLPDRVRDRIVEHVKADLVKVEPAKLPAHFRSLQAS